MPGRRLVVSLVHRFISTTNNHPIPPPTTTTTIIFSTTTLHLVPPPPPTSSRSVHTPCKLARCCASCANGLSCPYQRRFNLQEEEKKDTHPPTTTTTIPHNYPITTLISCAMLSCDCCWSSLWLSDGFGAFLFVFSCYIWWDEVMLPLGAEPTLRGLSTAAAAAVEASPLFHPRKEGPWSFLITV